MFAAIRQWVIKTMMKGQTGVVRTLPKNDLIELNTQITAERFLRNGINPEDMKTVGQVENVIEQIDAPKVKELTLGMTSVKKADVLDMEGNKIPEGSKIMGGKQIQPINMTVEERTGGLLKGKYESDEAIKARLVADNKKGIAGIKNNRMLNEDEIAELDMDIGGLEYTNDFDGTVGSANKLRKERADYIRQMELEYKKGNLDPEPGSKTSQRKRFLQKKLNEAEQSGDSRLISKEEREELFDLDDVPEYADGGRIGLKGGSGFLNFIKKFKVKKSGDDVKEFLSKRQFMKDLVGNTEKAKKARELKMLKEAMEEARNNPGFKFKDVDVDKDIRPIFDQSKDRTLNSDGGRIGLKGGSAFLNFIKKMGMNDKSPAIYYLKSRAQKGDMKTLAPEMGIIAGGGILTNRFLKKKLEKMNEDAKAEVEKKADIGLFMGSAYPKGAAALREMLNLFGKKSDSVKNPSDILRIVNPKQFNKTLEDPSIYRKFDVEKGIGAPDMIRNIQKKMTSDRQSTVKEMLGAAKNIKKSDDATLQYKNEMIEELMSKGADRKMAEEMAETISKIAENAAGKSNTPKLTDEGILQLENILKNMETGGKKPRDLNANGGRIGLKGGADASTFGNPNKSVNVSSSGSVTTSNKAPSGPDDRSNSQQNQNHREAMRNYQRPTESKIKQAIEIGSEASFLKNLYKMDPIGLGLNIGGKMLYNKFIGNQSSLPTEEEDDTGIMKMANNDFTKFNFEDLTGMKPVNNSDYMQLAKVFNTKEDLIGLGAAKDSFFNTLTPKGEALEKFRKEC